MLTTMMTPARATLIALTIAAAGCRGPGGPDLIDDKLLNTTAYTKVGMHFDTKRGRYVMASTNYISIPVYLPPGAALTLTKKNGRDLTLVDKDNSEYIIQYNRKHSMMPIDEWYDLHFSPTPVQLPESLTELEREAIREGVVRPGMSRESVFLAVGYPPNSTNPSLEADSLRYELRRFRSRRIYFNDNDVVEKISR